MATNAVADGPAWHDPVLWFRNQTVPGFPHNAVPRRASPHKPPAPPFSLSLYLTLYVSLLVCHVLLPRVEKALHVVLDLSERGSDRRNNHPVLNQNGGSVPAFACPFFPSLFSHPLTPVSALCLCIKKAAACSCICC